MIDAPRRLGFLPAATVAVVLAAVSVFAAPACANGPATPAAPPNPPGMAPAAAAAPAAPADSTVPDTTAHVVFPPPDSTLVPRLREGGYVIVFRHSITNWNQRDAEGENFEDRSVQRNLSQEGEEQATAIGKAFTKLEIPILAVLSSPMWRCRDTARLAFGREQPSVELFRRGSDYRAARITLMSSQLDAGENLVLVTHQDLLLPIVKGLKRDNLKEGDCFVVKPLGEGNFQVVAQVTPDDWARLAGLPPPPKPAAATTPPKASAPEPSKTSNK